MNLPSETKGKEIGRLLLWLLVGLLTWQCAQQARPQGGPRDKEPPTVTRSDPTPGRLNFDGDEVTVYFSETIRKPTYETEIFISPFMEPPEIRLADSYQRFTVKFREDLRPKTTYIVTITDIKDNSEGNTLVEPYLLAFSTGDQLDSLRLPGKIYTPKLGEPAKQLTVLLYDADSARQNEFFQATGLRKRPAYLSKTNDQGEFEFQYLRDGRYRVVGMEGQSKASGQLAITLDTVITIQGPQDSANLESIKLLAFEPDEQLPPEVLSYRLWSDSVADLSLVEGLRLDPLSIWLTDTLGQDSTPVRQFTLYRGDRGPRLLLQLSRPLPDSIYLQGLSDSLGYVADTAFRLMPRPPERRIEPWLQAPKLDVSLGAWRGLIPVQPTPTQLALFTLSDTARSDSLRQYYDLEVELDGFFLNLRPDTLPDPTAPYVLRFPGRAVGMMDSLYQDSVFARKLNWYDPSTYGSLSGRVELDSGYRGPILLEVIDGNQEVVATVRDTVFAFEQLKEGTYSFRVLLDADSNGVYTPGQLWPPRWPERRYEVKETVSLRGNWTFEDHVVKVLTTDRAAEQAAPPPSTEDEAGQDSTGQDPGGPGRRPGGIGGG